MESKKNFIRLIRDKCSGRPYDIEQYLNKMYDLIKKAYKNRYRALHTTEYGGGLLHVEFEEFLNYCFEELEDNNLISKFANVSCKNDSLLCRYIKKTFENLLQGKISKFTPGFQTRMKQVNRVLEPKVVNSCMKLCKCWKLLEFINVTLELADLDQLLDKSQSLPLPKLHQPKKSNLKRGPFIYDKDMEEYLISLLKGAGGMTTMHNLRLFIKTRYDLQTVRRKYPSSRNYNTRGEKEDSFEKQIERLPCQKGELLLSLDHILIAEELAAGLDPEMKEVYFLRIIEEKTIEKTADKMKKSVGTIHNIEKKYKDNIYDFFLDSGMGILPEERAGIMDIVSDLILRMGETQ